MQYSCDDIKYFLANGEADPEYESEFIDHIVFDKRSIVYVDRSSFRQVTYRQADMPDWNKISDHCPVVVEMWVR